MTRHAEGAEHAGDGSRGGGTLGGQAVAVTGLGVGAVRVELPVPGSYFPLSSCPRLQGFAQDLRTPQPGLLSEDAAPPPLGPGRLGLLLLSLGNRRVEQQGEAGQSLLGPRARGPVEDELALSPNQERLLLRSWVPRWPHQPPTAEAAPHRVPPEFTLQVTGRCLSDPRKK